MVAAQPSPFRKCCFRRSTVERHFGVMGLQIEFWLPKRPTSLTPCSRGTVSSHSTGTKYSQRSGSFSNFLPDAVSRREQLESPAVPSAAARADEAELSRVFPVPVLVMAKGAVELPVPRFARAVRLRRVDLRLRRIDQPRATEQLPRVVRKNLEAEHVDADPALAQVLHDTLAALIERLRHNHDLMTVVQDLFVQSQPKPALEIVGQTPARREPLIDATNVLRLKLLDSTRIVESLRHNIARRPVPLQLNQDKRRIRRQREQIDPPAKARVLLPPNEHPLLRQERRRLADHILEELLPGERGSLKRNGILSHLPEGSADGHCGRSGQGIMSNQP